jgi:hypothetical protein
MQLNEVPAKTGYVWFRQGIWLFRRNPIAFLALLLTYFFVLLAVSRVPFVGGILPLMIVPGAAVGFMAACRDTLAGKPVLPTILVDGYRSYGMVVARRLAALGIAYVAAIGVAFASSALADGGGLFKLMLGTADSSPEALTSGPAQVAALIALAVHIPVAMLFWFAPVLTAWHDVPPVKAVFFSVVSCWRNRGAFIVYAALWLTAIPATLFVLALAMEMLGARDYAFAVLFPAFVALTAMLYCSFYATYRGCFGNPAQNGADIDTRATP